jgi:hypothetical protein
MRDLIHLNLVGAIKPQYDIQKNKGTLKSNRK